MLRRAFVTVSVALVGITVFASSALAQGTEQGPRGGMAFWDDFERSLTYPPSHLEYNLLRRLERYWNQCKAVRYETRISGCTEVIEANNATPDQKKVAARRRALAHIEKSEYDAAIADYSFALEQRSTDRRRMDYVQQADAWLLASRAYVYIEKQDYPHAIEDSERALSLWASLEAARLSLELAKQRQSGSAGSN
jgi:tetratricopeptide (TPR) repeat protein